ncbi:unnamed protein product [Amoebophrya sp. A25]|nr:unnamed protein product [Amoebophrya sp. A25]|eukprot:GSA25T00013732001.1
MLHPGSASRLLATAFPTLSADSDIAAFYASQMGRSAKRDPDAELRKQLLVPWDDEMKSRNSSGLPLDDHTMHDPEAEELNAAGVVKVKRPVRKVPDPDIPGGYKLEHINPRLPLALNPEKQPPYNSWIYRDKLKEAGFLRQKAKQRRRMLRIADEDAKHLVDGPLNQRFRQVFPADPAARVNLSGEHDPHPPRQHPPTDRADGAMTMDELRREYPRLKGNGTGTVDPDVGPDLDEANIRPVLTEADGILNKNKVAEYKNFLQGSAEGMLL